MATTEEVYDQLRQVFDPEIPVNVVDLGLIYAVKVDGTIVEIEMTLTSQTCPEAQNIPEMIKRRVGTLAHVEDTRINIVWQPAWTPQLISAEGRKILGIDEE
ncbi:MAG: metal-sulfur cluster assembly factor [Planctomycetes bacterium]|nr:metal-sulfur cluster assembly factor [Planctomycetota bacterium]